MEHQFLPTGKEKKIHPSIYPLLDLNLVLIIQSNRIALLFVGINS